MLLLDMDMYEIYKNICLPEIRKLTSSAGSGKTTSLTTRYIQLMLSGYSYKHIFASTFTNKAAAEMRDRIISRLKKLARGDDKEIEVFKNITSLSKETIKDKAGHFIDEILLNYSDFAVRTLDSFTNSILQTFSVEIGLPPSFEIQQGIGGDIDYVIDSMIEDMPGSERLKEIFLGFIKNYLEFNHNSPNWLPVGSIKDKIKGFYLEDIKDVWDVEYNEKYKEEIENAYNEGKESIKGIANKLDEFSEYINNNFINAVNKLNQEEIEKSIVSKMWGKDYDTLILKSAKITEDEREKFKKVFNELASQIDKFFNVYIRQKLLGYNLIYYEFLKYFERHKQENGSIFLDELGKYVLDLHRDNIPVPFIYWKLGEKFKHFLIDEFQDTNNVQWENIKPLIEDSLSENGSLFVVGDKKQAIYNWRGGNANLIDRVFDFRSVPHQHKLSFPLSYNYRSRKNIVEFNNKLFQAIKDVNEDKIKRHKNAIEKVFKDVKQIVPDDEEKKGGYVWIKKIEDENKDAVNEHIKEIFKDIMEEVKERHNLSDIAVLVRSNSQGEQVVKWLQEMAISAVSASSLSVFGHPLIDEIIAFLRFLNNPKNNIAFISFVTGDIFTHISNLKRDELLKFFENIGGPNYMRFKERYPEEWGEFIEPILKSARWLPPYNLIQEIYYRFHILMNFPSAEAFFMGFLEFVANFEQTSPASIGEFIDYCDNMDENMSPTVALPEKPDAVNVMTLHKAKGLQFPVVIIPFTYDNIGMVENLQRVKNDGKVEFVYLKSGYNAKNIRELYLEKEEEKIIEDINLLYVGFTRAKDELYVLIPKYKGLHLSWAKILLNILFEDKDEIIIGAPIEKVAETIEEKVNNIPEISAKRDWENLIYTKIKNIEDHLNRERRMHIRRGNLAHYALSLITSLSEDDWEDRIGNAVIDTVYQNIPPSDREKWINELMPVLHKIFDIPEVKEWFFLPPDASVWREKEIMDKSGEIKRPDRVIIHPDRVVIVDFKTGEEEDEYRRQILEYKQLFNEYFPNKDISGYILYLDKLKVVNIE